MLKKAIATLLLSIVVLSHVLNAQTPLQGLSSQEVTCSLEDKYGFLWFGTANGLHRWDGVQMRVFLRRNGDTTSLPSNFITHLHRDRQGTLWVGTNAGLARLTRQNDRFVRCLPEKPIASLWEDSNGKIWVHFDRLGMNAGELAILDNGVLTEFTKAQGIHKPFVTAFAETMSRDDQQGAVVWIGTANGLLRYNRQLNQFSEILHDSSVSSSLAKLPQCRINALIADTDGTLLIGSNEGLMRLNPSTGVITSVVGAEGAVLALFRSPFGIASALLEKGSTKPTLDAAFVRIVTVSNNTIALRSSTLLPVIPEAGKPQQFRIWTDSTGTSYWGLGNGILRLNTQTATTELLFFDVTSPSRTNAPFTSIFRDQSGTLWWTRLGEGVLNDLPSINPFQLVQAVKGDKPFSALFADHSGNLWLGAQNSKSSLRFSPVSQTLKAFAHESSETTVGAFYETPSGEILCTSDGLEKLNGEGFKRSLLLEKQRLPAMAIAETNDGTLWVGTLFGLYKKSPPENGIVSTFQPLLASNHDFAALASNRPLNNSIHTLYADIDGTLWVGHEQGLDLYNSHNRLFAHLRAKAEDSISLADGEVTCIVPYSAPGTTGMCWIGTRGGLQLVSAKKAQVIKTFLRGIPIQSCVDDRKGTLWISSPTHLYALTFETEVLRRYDAMDGLPITEFLIRSAARTPDGHLWFGGRFNGAYRLLVFHPDSIKTNKRAPPVVLTGIKKFGSVAPLEDYLADMKTLTINYDETDIALEFIALNFNRSAKNQYSYTLERFDHGWNEAGNNREAKYTNLPPGEYVFRVKASNNDGVWNEQGTSLRVVVLPPWWATWWFRFGSLIFLICVVFFGYRWRTKELEKRNRELERMVEERTQSLKQAQAQLVQSERLNAQGMLTAGVMHEINSPNAAVIGAMEFAESMVLETKEYFLGLIDEENSQKSQVLRMQEMFNKIMEIHKVVLYGSIRIKKIVASLQTFTQFQNVGTSILKVAEEVNRSVNLLYYQYKMVSVVLNIPENLTLDAHWGELNQVFLNLFMNSAQAQATEIIVSTEEYDKKVIFTVSDNGEGMTAEVQAKIFEPFFTTKDVGNSGLGLYITKNIVEKHNAQIEVESRRGQGTTIRIIFG